MYVTPLYVCMALAMATLCEAAAGDGVMMVRIKPNCSRETG